MATYDTVDLSLLGNRQPAASSYSWGNRIGSGLKGVLGDQDLALALLANSGWSPQKRSFGEVFGTSALQAKQMKNDREDQQFKRRYMEAQMAALTGKNQQPPSVREYEYARQSGFKGSFQDWIVAGGQSSRPSSVQEWEFYNSLPDEQKPLYLEMKRNPNFTVKDVNQVPTSIHQSIAGGITARPLSDLKTTAAAAETVKQAEGAGAALGSAQGGIAGEIQKKGSNAKSVLGMIEEAEAIVDDATGSLAGAGADIVAGGLGKSTEGSRAISKLKVLQAGLMLNMPRMEGPQSDRDVELYREAAASLGDPTVPRENKKAALEMIRNLQIRYAERAAAPVHLFPEGTQTPDGWTVLPNGVKIREKP